MHFTTPWRQALPRLPLHRHLGTHPPQFHREIRCDCPGPIEVQLPVDPHWKNEYAATVRRLVRDGVDAPVANTVAHAARTASPHAEGISRARSATKEFLYRTLKTLPDTSGRFRLNVELPIPFVGHGRRKVDLLRKDSCVAIELDGSQRLDGAEVYRRDPCKDLPLPENGYFELRFLAEDVGYHLDAVLAAILRALANRQTRELACLFCLQTVFQGKIGNRAKGVSVSATTPP